MNKKDTKKKSTKPAFIVDVTNCETLDDVAVVFALAKHNAGLPLTDKNLMAIMNDVVDKTVDHIPFVISLECKCENPVQEKVKRPWYKRFWRWLFGKK